MRPTEAAACVVTMKPSRCVFNPGVAGDGRGKNVESAEAHAPAIVDPVG